MDIFFQIGVMFIIATVGAYLAKLIKQPMIPAYIIAGVIIGPVMGVITNSTIIKTLSEIGIAFLLFIVGLELNLKKLKDTGPVATLGGLIEVLVVTSAGFIAAVLLGYTNKEAIYMGLILAFSSTMVVVKLLSDKRELETLHGRIIIGILLVQDIIAIFALSMLTTIDGFFVWDIVMSLAKAAALMAAAYLLSKYTFPVMFKKAAESQELLLLMSLGICFLFSIAISYIGFSIAVGAFIAGLSLANLPYNIEIIGRVKSLRDFFATMFFVSLGMELISIQFFRIMLPLAVFLVIVVVLKPFVIMLMCSIFKYTKRTSFLSAMSLAQVSEFSLIMAAFVLNDGSLSNNIFSITIILAIITITATSYIVKFENKLFSMLSKPLSVFDIKETGEHMQYLPQELEYDIILVGYDRIGYNVFKMLTKAKKSFFVIDFNPDIVKRLVSRKVPCIYGDIGDPEILDRLNLKKTQLVISTVPDLNDSIHIIKKVKRENPKAIVFVTASIIEEALRLYREGADYVVLPHFLGGEKVSSFIEETAGDHRKVSMIKLEHICELKKRIEMEHEHPRKA